MKTEIQLKIGEKKVIYDSITNTATYFTRGGVLIEAEMPKDFALTRIFQFIESLIKSELI
jgi:hypothetical protein|tara:strand:- start:2 stop:181 length:180 start_codon:yes stop_codon:yes gene_type:complete